MDFVTVAQTVFSSLANGALYAFIGLGDGVHVVTDHLWRFCLGALGGNAAVVIDAE